MTPAEFHRDYVVDSLTADRAAAFAAATVIAHLAPDRWQVSQDVATVCHDALCDHWADDPRGAHTLAVTVALRGDAVALTLVDDLGWTCRTRVRRHRRRLVQAQHARTD